MATRAGRRRGESGTREAIAASARKLFAEAGYDRVTLRAIAADAGVDPALVIHYFGSKERLFVSVVGLPFEPREVLPAVLAGDRETVGERFARFVVGLLETPEARTRVTSIVRAAASEPSAADILRDLISTQVVSLIAEILGIEKAELRATLVGTQVTGLVMVRYVVRVEPIASAPPDAVIAAIAPTLQRYLAEPLD